MDAAIAGFRRKCCKFGEIRFVMSRQLAKVASVIKRTTWATSILSFRSFAFAVAFVLFRLHFAFAFAFAFALSFGASLSVFGEKQRAATFVASSLTFQRVQFVAPVRRMHVSYIFLLAKRVVQGEKDLRCSNSKESQFELPTASGSWASCSSSSCWSSCSSFSSAS